MVCHATVQKPANNRLQSLYHLLTSFTNDYLTKIILQLAVFTTKFFKGLRNKRTVVHEGTSYPSNRTPMGVLISE